MQTNIVRTFVGTFEPLRMRNFTIYLGGQAVSLTGTYIQVTAQGWVVWQMSHSPSALGLVAMLAALPLLLLGPWAGGWADRLDRRKLLIGTQVAAMFLAFLLAFLVQTQHVRLWNVYLLALLLGIVTALDQPAQQAFLGDLTGVDQMQRAVNLNGMILQVSRMIGPALAGFVISGFGTAIAFWLNGLSFLAVIGSLCLVRANQVRKAGVSHPLGDFVDALKFIRTQPRLLDLLVFVAWMTFFGMSVVNLFPAVASQVLHGDERTLSLLMAILGLGALISVVFVVPFAQSMRRPGLVVASAVVWMGTWLAITTSNDNLPMWLFCNLMIWLSGPVVMTMALGLLQRMAPADMRGRLVSLWVMVGFGMQPLGNLWMGYSAEILGVRLAIFINGLILLIGATMMVTLRGGLRTWRISTKLVS